MISGKKCSLKYHPPTLILFYNDLDTGKYRRRSMPLRGLGETTNIDEYCNSLCHSRHQKYVRSMKAEQLKSLLEKVRQAQQAKDKSFEKSCDFDSTAEESLLLAPGLLDCPKPSASELRNHNKELDRILSASIRDSEEDELQLDRKSKLIHASSSIKPKVKESPALQLGMRESDDINNLLLGETEKLPKPNQGGLTMLSSLPPLSSAPLSKLPTLTSSPPAPITTTATGSQDFLNVLNQSDHDDYEDDFEELPSQHPPLSPGHHLASLSQDKLSMLSDGISEEEEEEGGGEDERSDDTPLMKDFEDLQLTLSPDDDLDKLAETSYHKRRLSLEDKLKNDKTMNAIESAMYSDDSAESEF